MTAVTRNQSYFLSGSAGVLTIAPNQNGTVNSEGNDQSSVTVDLAKREAQIQSAKRSLLTNITLMMFFTASHSSIFLLPEPERIVFTVAVFSLLKGVMPIGTTIANFGTIQVLVSKYWSILKKDSEQQTNSQTR